MIQNWTIEVLTHRKISGRNVDGSDAKYSKGVAVIIEGLKVNNPSDMMLLRLAKSKRTDLMITKLLFRKLKNPVSHFGHLNY